ncbi:MAG: enoyl-CoA hydratase-related protein [Geobacteraceae bacterium]|nr:enoyl-CoA hydratase-related protein [Geobacteraceae bacterium]
MITDDVLHSERKNRIRTLTLNRIGTRNALDSAMLRFLDEALAACEGDEETRAVIITGSGNFCAGADIRELDRMNEEQAKEFIRMGNSVLRRIETLSKVVIAAVAGHAMGGGCELALACDIRIAGESARFGLPEVSLGLIPGFGGTQRLGKLVGHGRARELILTGRTIDSREAVAIGLVSSVVDDRELPVRAQELAERLAQKSPHAQAAIKKLLMATSQLDKGLELEAAAFGNCFASQDRREGISAFIEKRHPVF